MASAPPANQLPLFYKALQPLSSSAHANYKVRQVSELPSFATAHAIPITVDEFVQCQRYYPIVFSVGPQSLPLALMALNEGANVFVDAAGKPMQEMYVPAYVRRYPFMLAKLRPESEELSLCYDPESGRVGEFEDGQALFAEGKATEATDNVLKFCEEFELSAQRTASFMQDLMESDLLIDGEISIQPADAPQPFVYRGFRMVDENKLRELRGDTLRKMNQNGMLPLIFAHLFSMPHARELFAKQMQQGKLNTTSNLPFGNA